MKKFSLFFFLVFGVATCTTPALTPKQVLAVNSPNSSVQVKFLLSSDGQPGYSVHYKDKLVIKALIRYYSGVIAQLVRAQH